MIAKLLAGLIMTAPIALVAALLGRRPVTVALHSPDARGITVSGEGEAEAPPDTATLSVGVSVQAKTVAEARASAAAAGAAVVASVKANGVAAADVQTQNLSIQPVYDYRNGQEPRITGYTVSNSLAIRVRDIDSVSKVIDEVAAAGGDATRIDSVAFSIANPTGLLDRAREAAVLDARRKAELLARAAGVTLGRAEAISEAHGNPGIPRREMAMMRMAADAEASTPVEAGTNKVRVAVTVRFGVVGDAR